MDAGGRVRSRFRSRQAVSPTDGFDTFYRDNYARVVVSLRVAAGSRDDAEDLAQEAFARTLTRWARVRDGPSPVGYVYRVAFRLQRRSRWRRRRQRELEQKAAELRGIVGWNDVEGAARDDVAAVREALNRLPPACRRVAALCFYAELTAAEAADVLGVRASTVRTQLQRARAGLTAALASEGGQPTPAL